MNFKVGDIVEIVKTGYGAEYEELLGLRGLILVISRKNIKYAGVTFDENSIQMLKNTNHTNLLHNLNGAIKSNTGRYIGLACLSLAEEEIDEL